MPRVLIIQTGLAAGTTYYYIVTAVNSAGEGAASAQASAATNAAPPAAMRQLPCHSSDDGAHDFHVNSKETIVLLATAPATAPRQQPRLPIERVVNCKPNRLECNFGNLRQLLPRSKGLVIRPATAVAAEWPVPTKR